MHIHTNVPLKSYSTMRLGGIAETLATITTKDELVEALDWAAVHAKPWLVLGGGSNVIFEDGWHGLIIINALHGFELREHDDGTAQLKIGSGENWDDVVARSVAQGLVGIERLSAIPGTAGATPVQNVGAYGAEIADALTELEAYDIQAKAFTTLSKADCQFSYRSSIFKSLRERRYIITSITLRLTREWAKPPFYDSLQKYLDEHHITDYSPAALRSAVVAIRAHSLPDPKLLANTGSFFKNPIVPAGLLTELRRTYPDIPSYDMPDGHVKLLAGWLIDHAGLKGYRAHGMRVYENNALVFVNDSASSYADLAAFKQEIVAKVHATFGVTLEQEPELIP